jgi:hypothetical protein
LLAEIPLDAGAHGPGPSALSFDSRMIALPDDQKDLRLYSIPEGKPLATLSAPGSKRIAGEHAIEFSRDGRWLLALGEDGEVIAWDLHVIRGMLTELGLDWDAPASQWKSPPRLSVASEPDRN